MLHTVHSQRTLPEIEQALQESAARHKFGILTIHDLRETMAKKGVVMLQIYHSNKINFLMKIYYMNLLIIFLILLKKKI